MPGFLYVDDRLSAQEPSFSSGSTGEDGALDFTGVDPGTAIELDPDNADLFDPPRVLDQDGDGIYQFTTILIPAGITVHLSARHLDGPVFWLAAGDVNINGKVDLDAEVPRSCDKSVLGEIDVQMAGAGGYPGGIQGGPTWFPTAGKGPGGGEAFDDMGVGQNATFTGNRFLVPLIGGSGGGGGTRCNGGAGGGAILIASSTKIAISACGSITALGGGECCFGDRDHGQGSGGAIRLVAGTMNINTSSCFVLNVAAGNSNTPMEKIRIEAFSH